MINVIEGFCAIRIGKYWVGVCEGNHYAEKNRRTSKKALKDAHKLLMKIKGSIK